MQSFFGGTFTLIMHAVLVAIDQCCVCTAPHFAEIWSKSPERPPPSLRYRSLLPLAFFSYTKVGVSRKPFCNRVKKATKKPKSITTYMALNVQLW